MTPESECPGKNTADMMSSPTENVPPLRKKKNSKMGSKHHYEGSEAIDTNHYHCYKETENTKDKE